jgi:hypothetical protein
MTETLEQKAARAEAKAAAERRRAEQAALDELEVYERRLDEWDRKVLDAFDEEMLREGARAAYRAFEQAVADNEIFQHWIAYRAAVEVHVNRATEAANIAERLGSPKRIPIPGWGAESLVGALEQAISKAAGAAVADDMDARAEARERYAGEVT